MQQKKIGGREGVKLSSYARRDWMTILVIRLVRLAPCFALIVLLAIPLKPPPRNTTPHLRRFFCSTKHSSVKGDDNKNQDPEAHVMITQ